MAVLTRGRFITLEGSEGVGKTTNLAVIASTLDSLGIRFVSTREPGGTPLAEEIRLLLLAARTETVAPLAELLLVFAARAQHLERVVKPALDAGTWVISDRFTDATYAYQGGGRRMDPADIALLEKLVQGSLQPDLTLYLDLDPDVASTRMTGRERDRFESESRAFFDRVRRVYLERASGHRRFRIIDASGSLDAVATSIRDVITTFVAATRGASAGGDPG